jgi:uncharacterized membrane protein YgdD (TMEM256/DUF423 family)
MERREIPETQERIGSSPALRLAALLGLSAVILGAFGAHALKTHLAANGTNAIWEKAVFYHLIHAVMLYVLAARNGRITAPWVCFALGILFFSGSLYGLAVTRAHWLGPITPLGGIFLMAGWICLMVCPHRPKPGTNQSASQTLD